VADDEPPWQLDEPDDLMDDLPPPTRARPGGPGVRPSGERAALDDEPDIGLDGPSAREEPSAIALPPASPEFERTPLGTQWYELIARCNAAGSLVALVRELAMQAELLGWDGAGDDTVARLRVARETLRNPALADKLANHLKTQLGHAVRLVVEAGEPQDCPARRDLAEAERRQRAAIATIQSDPTVRALLAQFRTARILPGSIKPL